MSAAAHCPMNPEHAKVSDQLKQDCEVATSSIIRCKKIGEALAESTDFQRRLLQELDERLNEIYQKVPLSETTTLQLGRLRNRINRLAELRNMQELGSFSVEVKRAMEAAWRDLP